MMFYVYELSDPRDGTVFYVGKGKGNRRFDHEAEARRGIASDKCDRIREILECEQRPMAHIVATFADEAQAYRAEAERIASYGLENLTNIAPGGNGGASNPITEARRAVRMHGQTIQRILDCHSLGVSVTWRGLDFVRLGYDVALDLRKRVGAEYFDQHVRAA
jgi:hypothetical protein